jgi:hypothetical protein
MWIAIRPQRATHGKAANRLRASTGACHEYYNPSRYRPYRRSVGRRLLWPWALVLSHTFLLLDQRQADPGNHKVHATIFSKDHSRVDRMSAA